MAPPAVDGSKKPVAVETHIELPADVTPPADTAATGRRPLEAAPPAAPKSRVAKHTEGTPTTTVTPPDDRFVLRPGLLVTGGPLGGVGGKDGGLFNKDFNEATHGGSFTFTDLSVAADFRVARLFGDQASFFIGPRLAFQHHGGDRASGGSAMNLGQLALSLGLDWKNSMASWNILLPSRVAIYGGGICGTGETDAGNHFSVATTKGCGVALGAQVDLFGFKINKAGDSVQIGWNIESGNIPNARGDSPYPYWFTGVGVSVPLAWPGSIEQVHRVDTDIEICKADSESLVALRDRVAGMLTSAQASFTTYNSYAELVKKEFSVGKLRDALRAGKIKALTLAETAKIKLTSPEMKQADLDKALAAKQPEFKAAAEAAYPGDYNHYEIRWPEFTLNLETLEIPTDCEAQEKLLEQLTDMKEKLIEVSTRVEERTHWIYIELGRKAPPPPVSVALDFPMVLFDTARPNIASYSKKYADDVKRISEYMASHADKFPITDPADAELFKVFGPIFKGDKAAKQRQINHLFNDAQILNGKVLPRNIDVSKLETGEEDRIRNFMQTIDVRIEAHTSKSGAGKDPASPEDPMMKLSQRRTDGIIELLVAFGVDRTRLTGIGYGFSRPADETDNGNEATPAAVINRRLVFMIDPKGRHVSKEEPPPPPKAETPADRSDPTVPDGGAPAPKGPDAGAPDAAPKK